MEVANDMKKYTIDIGAVQEIRWKGQGKINKREFREKGNQENVERKNTRLN